MIRSALQHIPPELEYIQYVFWVFSRRKENTSVSLNPLPGIAVAFYKTFKRPAYRRNLWEMNPTSGPNRIHTMNAYKLLSIVVAVLVVEVAEVTAQYHNWKHTRSLYIITTSDGANLPATALEKNVPLLVRLHQDFFDFSQAKSGGEDIRFSANGQPLAYQIERWNPSAGHADIWVRIPTIKGDDQQAITMHWGNSKVTGESNGEKVFQTTEGFAGVWHLGDNLEDATANNLDGFNKPDKPTTNTSGIIGDAQEFGVDKFLVIRPPGAERDRRVTCMPSGNADRTLSAWVHPTSFEGRNWASATIGGWGAPPRGVKPNMGLSYMTNDRQRPTSLSSLRL